MLESLSNEVPALNFIRKRLQHRRFPVNFAKRLRTPLFIEHLYWLLLEIKNA